MSNMVRIGEPVLKTLGYESIRKPPIELSGVISIISRVLVGYGTRGPVGLSGFLVRTTVR